MELLKDQLCPICNEKKMNLIEDKKEIPFFGNVYLFSMHCDNCHYHKADVEAEEQKEPCKITFTIEKEDDMKIRVVKGGEATVKVPQLRMSVEGGPNGE